MPRSSFVGTALGVHATTWCDATDSCTYPCLVALFSEATDEMRLAKRQSSRRAPLVLAIPTNGARHPVAEGIIPYLLGGDETRQSWSRFQSVLVTFATGLQALHMGRKGYVKLPYLALRINPIAVTNRRWNRVQSCTSPSRCVSLPAIRPTQEHAPDCGKMFSALTTNTAGFDGRYVDWIAPPPLTTR